MTKLAFLFLTKGNHKCIRPWQIFFKNVSKDLYSIYTHPKTEPSQAFIRDNCIQTVIPTRWGDISLIRATILLLKYSYEDPANKYFILLSDSCIPVISFDILRNSILREDKTWISWKYNENKLDRYQKLHPALKKYIPSNKFYSQHQWIILKRSHVKTLLETDITPYFNNMHAADEHYFVVLLYFKNLLNETECINHKITYCDWSDITSMHPTEFTHVSEKLIDIAQTNRCFFLRKVAAKAQLCNYLINILNNNNS